MRSYVYFNLCKKRKKSVEIVKSFLNTLKMAEKIFRVLLKLERNLIFQ